MEENCGEIVENGTHSRAITKGVGDNNDHSRTLHDEDSRLHNDEFEEDEDISSPNGTMLGTNVIEVFQPKLVQVVDAYRMYLSSQSFPDFDPSKHLLILCLDHLITFCSWARASPARSSWISKTLEENSDLRPEVRNGLCMIMVYGFSAVKAVTLNDGKSDMFSVLQEADTGFGIVNKTSLKVYNDPYQYFNFLKYCVSGLIDVGRIPENERINQVKSLCSTCCRFLSFVTISGCC
jgi:hypothetical protein